MSLPSGWMQPVFHSPRVRALMTARDGGQSAAPFDTLNLRDGLGDAAEAVARNRARLHQALGMPSVMLRQVHGLQVLDLSPGMADGAEADASLCLIPGLACEVQVADCLPVLMADRQGRGVAAAHAGWRGLAGGVVEATLHRLSLALGCPAAEVEVWLGPCIGPQAFEVGVDVLAGFGVPAGAPGPRFRPLRPDKWLADLPGLARDRLAGLGVQHVAGNDGSQAWCTFSQPSRFFSYRRDGVTGRMAACIGLLGSAGPIG